MSGSIWKTWGSIGIAIGGMACKAEPDSEAVQATDSALIRTPWEPHGLPGYHRSPHARAQAIGQNSPLYVEGILSDGSAYSLYHQQDAVGILQSSTLRTPDGKTTAQMGDIGPDSSQWNQLSTYLLNELGETSGQYFTTERTAVGEVTTYDTAYSATSTSATYETEMDFGHTAASPDCQERLFWTPSSTDTWQLCLREDASYWTCDIQATYTPSYDTTGQQVGSQRMTQQACNDSRTDMSPDYQLTDELTVDAEGKLFRDFATLQCYELHNTPRRFYYLYEAGIGSWYDEEGWPVAAPTCGWSESLP